MAPTPPPTQQRPPTGTHQRHLQHHHLSAPGPRFQSSPSNGQQTSPARESSNTFSANQTWETPSAPRSNGAAAGATAAAGPRPGATRRLQPERRAEEHPIAQPCAYVAATGDRSAGMGPAGSRPPRPANAPRLLPGLPAKEQRQLHAQAGAQSRWHPIAGITLAPGPRPGRHRGLHLLQAWGASSGPSRAA